MKKLGTAVLIWSFFQLFATMTYGQADTTLGTEQEQAQQAFYMRDSRHGHRVVLAGSRSGWLNELNMFIQQRGYGITASSAKPGIMNLTFTEKTAIGSSPKKFVAQFFIGSDDRIKKVVMNGSAKALIGIFLNYWGVTTINESESTGATKLEQRFITDRITWSSDGVRATLTVSRSE